MNQTTWLFAMVLCAGVGPAQAAEIQVQTAAGVQYYGLWQMIYSHEQPFPLNEAGQASGLGWVLDNRLDAGFAQELSEKFAVEAELRVFYGQVDGDLDHVGALLRPDARETLRGWDLRQAELRSLFLRFEGSSLEIQAGQMRRHFGLGLLENDGRPALDRFGFQTHGDISDRLLLRTRPLAGLFPDSFWGDWILLVGAGLVYQDENCDLRKGDLGGEVLLSLSYPGPVEGGLYVAGRFEMDEDGRRQDTVVLDAFAKHRSAGSGLWAEAELAFLAGATDRVEHVDGARISAFGAVARAGWEFSLLGLRPLLEAGFASGDPNPHDATVSAFAFDPDFKVGLVLFDTILRAVSAMDAEESADPALVGRPLPGASGLATGGRVTNAFYVHPTLRLKPLAPLTLLVGLLYARSAVELAQSYQTFRNGDIATNSFGRLRPGHELGFELDVGAEWDQALREELHLRLGAQAGWFFPGSALERPDGSRPGIVARLVVRAALTW